MYKLGSTNNSTEIISKKWLTMTEILAYYQGVPLFHIQYDVLKAIEEVLGEPIPPVKDVDENSFWFRH